MMRRSDDPIRQFNGPYKFLSNFYRSTIQMFEGEAGSFPSAEHAFQAAKPVYADEQEAIRTAATPAKAKQMGRGCSQIRPDWDNVKLSVMEDILRKKFASGSELAQRLLETGDRMLIEGNWWGDHYWGVCNGRGENHLGQILMKIRAELRGKRKYKGGSSANKGIRRRQTQDLDQGEPG